MKKRHHYVPRFYLKAFASNPSDPKRIHIYNLTRNIPIANASLRDQCYAHKLYGEDDTIEDAFSVVEGAAAQLIARMRTERRAPHSGTDDHRLLRVFMAYQMARTESAIARVVAYVKALERAAFTGKKAPEEWGGPEDQAMAISLSTAPVVADSLADLAMTIVQAHPGSTFIVSDSPVFLYNQYCQGVKHFGVTGAQNEGLQIFFPLSPSVLLFLYDKWVYKVGSRDVNHVTASTEDMHALNRLQFVSARENVYFSDWSVAARCKAFAGDVAKVRSRIRPHVNVAVAENDDRQELLHAFVSMPQLGIDFSFVSIRRNARRVKVIDRARRNRRPYMQPMARVPKEGDGHRTRYVVRRRQ